MGGTKLEGVVLPSKDDWSPLFRYRIDTEAQHGYDHIMGRVGVLIQHMTHEVGEPPECIGFGTPGSIDPRTGLMKNCNTVVLNHQPMPEDLRKVTGREVIVANDANCFALAEATCGAGKGSEVVFGVILGTGVGGGVVVHGKALNGVQGIAGEWGHNVLEPGGTPCYCGKAGCVETVLSGTGLERWYAEHSGTRRKLKEIAVLAEQGEDEVAKATLDRLVTRFGEAISVVVNVLDPQVVILGGGVGNIPRLVKEAPTELAKWVFNTYCGTEIRQPLLGDSAGVFGAAMLTV